MTDLLVLLEHESIGYALSVAGIEVNSIAVPQLVELVDDSGQANVAVMCWSSPEVLLLQPEWAILSLRSIARLQLPASRQSIDRWLVAPPPVTSCSEALPLLLPLGQYRWAWHELRSKMAHGVSPRLHVLLKNLRRFAGKHWPGWFDDGFAVAGDALARGDVDTARRLCQVLLDSAGKAATYSCFRPLFHGAANDIRNGGAGQAKAALGYLITDLAACDESDRQYIARPLQSRWWEGLQEELTSVAERLRMVQMSGFDPDEVLQGRLQAVNDHLRTFVPFAESVLAEASDWGDGLQKAHLDISAVVDTLHGLEGEASKYRAELEESFDETDAVG